MRVALEWPLLKNICTIADENCAEIRIDGISMESLPFDYRRVFSSMNRNNVSYLLVGGLNYFLAHKPVATQDIDLLVCDTQANRAACECALIELGAEWGRRDDDWGSVKSKRAGWLWGQSVFCLLTQFGPVDIFFSLPGISSYLEAEQRATSFDISENLRIRLISARDLLNCQLALPEIYRKQERIQHLNGVIEND